MPRMSLWVCSAMLLSVVAGCTALLVRTVDPILPAAVQYLVDHADQFTSLDDVTLDPQPAAVATAEELAGCWGRVAEQVTTNVANVQDVVVTLYEVYQFDADTGAATYEVFFHDGQGRLDIVMVGTGTYEVPEAGRAVVNIQSWQGNDPLTGALEDLPDGPPQEITLDVQRSGDYLVATEVPDEPDEEDSAESFRFLRFECPG